MLQAVLFDLFETLVTESRTQPPGVSSLAPALRCDRRVFRREWKLLRPAVVIGARSFAEAVSDAATRTGGHADPVMLGRLCQERVRIKAGPFARIEPQVLTMIDALRARGLRLGVVSNCFAEDVTAWRECPLASRVDCAIFSFEVGLAKPDPRIFQEAARRVGVSPPHAWYIGDGADGELRGAEEAGMRSFKCLWFLRRWPHFREEADSCDTLSATDDVLRLVAGACER